MAGRVGRVRTSTKLFALFATPTLALAACSGDKTTDRRYSTVYPDVPGRVLDRSGNELLAQHIVTLVNVAPGADLNAVAALLNPLDSGITPASLQAELATAQGKPVTAISLRETDIGSIS